MITNDEIAKLAREYAEEAVSVRHITAIVADEAEQVISWLLRTHCIVSKEKVRKMHTALSKDKSMLRNWEEREIFDARISMLNHLFGKDLFIDNDGRT